MNTRVLSLALSFGLSSTLALLPHAAKAATVTLNPVADATMIETSPDNNMGGMEFFNSGTAGNGFRNRGLLRFDLSGAIPQGSTIQTATLGLTVVLIPAVTPQSTLFGIHRVLSTWGEGDNVAEFSNSPGLGAPADPGEVSWNHRFAGSTDTWAVPGGQEGVDYVGNASSVEFIEDESLYNFDTTPRLLNDLQGWVDDPQSNQGWMLISFSEEERFSARRFGSREDPFAAPTLTITFEPIPEPHVLTLGLLGWAAAFGLRRGRSRA